MSNADQLLLVGSLPPTRSDAALLTHAIAAAASECGINVVCLIDALAPPPIDVPFRVVRPFDDFIQSGEANNWPRLFVVGGEGDSLPVIEALHAAPGAVVSASRSLFALALPWLKTSTAYPSNFSDWLTTKHGAAGSTIAEGFIEHRRLAKQLAREIPAFDLLLKPATRHLSLGTRQQSTISGAGFTPTKLLAPPLPAAAKPTTQQRRESSLRITVIGASPETQSAVSEAAKTNKAFSEHQVSFFDRFDQSTTEEILASGAVAILDGHDAAWCPHFELAAANEIPLITAGQSWAETVPMSAKIYLDNPASPSAVVHALAALSTVDGLLSGLKHALQRNFKQRTADAQKPNDWCNNILAAATTAKPAKLEKINPAFGATEGRFSSENTNLTDLSDGSVLALIGAVPASPLLRRNYPELDTEKSPRFLTPNHAHTMSAFMGVPASQMQDNMGFEAPLIKDGADGAEKQTLDRKVRTWADIKPGLRQAKQAVTFGCQVAGAAQALLSAEKLRWPFRISTEIAENSLGPKALTSAYDAYTGIYWSYDPVRGALKCIILTGGAGILAFSTAGPASFIITDLTSTQIASQSESCRFDVAAHGLCFFKVAALPLDDNNNLDIMNLLAQSGLLLEWSAS